jgi:hypothetical protein
MNFGSITAARAPQPKQKIPHWAKLRVPRSIVNFIITSYGLGVRKPLTVPAAMTPTGNLCIFAIWKPARFLLRLNIFVMLRAANFTPQLQLRRGGEIKKFNSSKVLYK